MEGQDKSAIRKIWDDLAATEMRLKLMSDLISINVGLADVEEFNLDLKGNLKNQPSEKFNEEINFKMVRAAMSVKLKDEQVTRGKLVKARNKARSNLMKELGRNSKKYRTVIRSLRKSARETKIPLQKLYDEKLPHLRTKYRETENEKLDKVPVEIQEWVALSVFDREKFDTIDPLAYEVTCVGEVTLTNEEKSILSLHPKFSLMEDLEDDNLEFEQELSYSKVRIQLNKELNEADEIETMSPEEELAAEEEDAKSRLTFDPLNKIYNDRKRRATDLQECSRVTLPKPLPTKQEAHIEMRRGVHTQI